MIISIDKNIFPDNCISEVVYWLSGQYMIQRRTDGESEVIIIENVEDEEAFKHLFFQKLNDFKLREIIDESTKDIKTILYAKAFGEFDALTEDDIAE